jgi:hypothetical protein
MYPECAGASFGREQESVFGALEADGPLNERTTNAAGFRACWRERQAPSREPSQDARKSDVCILDLIVT